MPPDSPAFPRMSQARPPLPGADLADPHARVWRRDPATGPADPRHSIAAPAPRPLCGGKRPVAAVPCGMGTLPCGMGLPIGVPVFPGRSHAAHAVALRARQITRHPGPVLADPDPSNERAVRAWRRAGPCRPCLARRLSSSSW